MNSLNYRTHKLRDTERVFRALGGIEAAYRFYAAEGWTRKQIAAKLGLTVIALEKWITKWNKARKAEEGRERNRHEGESSGASSRSDH